jgi:hypothetical protein
LFCFGHDLGLAHPNNASGRALHNGTTAIHLLRGEYTLIAFGSGYFISQRRPVLQSGKIILRADTYTTLTLLDRNRAPIAGCNVGAVDSTLKVLMPFHSCGTTKTEPFALQVYHASVLDVGVYKGPAPESKTGEAYAFHFPDVPAGRKVVFRTDPAKLARLRVGLYDPSGQPAVNSRTLVEFASLWVERTPIWLCRDSSASWSELDLWMTPELAVLAADSELPGGWRFSFYPKVFDLEAGAEYTVRFGGAIQPRVWFLPDSTWVAPGAPGAQVWVDLDDGHGGGISAMTSPTDLGSSVLRVADQNGQRVEDVQLPGGACGKISKYVASHYTIDLNLGLFGKHSLAGKCDDPANLLQTTAAESAHFHFEVPTWSREVLPRFTAAAEAAHAALAEALQCQLTGKVNYHTYLGGGMASGLHIFCGASWFKDQRIMKYPGAGYWSSFQHELAHVFQGASVGLPAQFYGPNPGHGEAFVAALEPFIFEKSFGDKYRYMYDLGGRSRFFCRLYHKAGYDGEVPGPPDGEADYYRYYFVLAYLRDALGPGVFRDFARLWGVPERQKELKQICGETGLNDNEMLCVFYSLAAKQNLAWLFSLAGFECSEAKVSSAGSKLVRCPI